MIQKSNFLHSDAPGNINAPVKHKAKIASFCHISVGRFILKAC